MVRAFKTQLVEIARDPATLDALSKRIPSVLGRVLVGAGGKVSAGQETVALVVGPTAQLDRYEKFLQDSGEATFLPAPLPPRLLAGGREVGRRVPAG